MPRWQLSQGAAPCIFVAIYVHLRLAHNWLQLLRPAREGPRPPWLAYGMDMPPAAWPLVAAIICKFYAAGQ